MLLELLVENFAIIERLLLSFGPGLNVLTGETGAGKSLIIDAISALLGGRVGEEVIRSGADCARIEGVFSLQGREEELRKLLAEYGIDAEEGILILSREISRGGRSRARVNRRPVPLRVLAEIGRHLVDIHGQTEHLSLLDPRTHIFFLDGFAGLSELRRRFGERIEELREVERELERIRSEEKERERRRDLLSYEIREIEEASLSPGEEEELRKERDILAHAEKILTACDLSYRALSGRASDGLREAISSLKPAARFDPSLNSFLAELEGMSSQLDDLLLSLRSHVERLQFDPKRFEQIEERLFLISKLKKKYGETIEEILEYAERARRELEELSRAEERGEELARRREELRRELGEMAFRLSESRREAARRLSEMVERELEDLNMKRVRFEVSILQEEDPEGLPSPEGRCFAFDENGIDKVEFLIATNPGEPPRPLSKIASGGETSRIMLALKVALRSVDPVPVLIFDEIDSGIGGRSGEVVGRKLWELAGEHQVFCITHLPQIACLGDQHYSVSKEVINGRTRTSVRNLMKREERVKELAAMLGGGEKMEEGGLELLERAERWKREKRRI